MERPFGSIDLIKAPHTLSVVCVEATYIQIQPQPIRSGAVSVLKATWYIHHKPKMCLLEIHARAQESLNGLPEDTLLPIVAYTGRISHQIAERARLGLNQIAERARLGFTWAACAMQQELGPYVDPAFDFNKIVPEWVPDGPPPRNPKHPFNKDLPKDYRPHTPNLIVKTSPLGTGETFTLPLINNDDTRLYLRTQFGRKTGNALIAGID